MMFISQDWVPGFKALVILQTELAVTCALMTSMRIGVRHGRRCIRDHKNEGSPSLKSLQET